MFLDAKSPTADSVGTIGYNLPTQICIWSSSIHQGFIRIYDIIVHFLFVVLFEKWSAARPYSVAFMLHMFGFLFSRFRGLPVVLLLHHAYRFHVFQQSYYFVSLKYQVRPTKRQFFNFRIVVTCFVLYRLKRR